MAILFRCPTVAIPDGEDAGRHDFLLGIDCPATKQISFSLKRGDDAPVAKIFACDTGGLDTASFSYADLQDVITIGITLDASARPAFEANGLAGLNLSARAALKSVVVVLRPRPAGGDWSAAVPCFSLTACWAIAGTAKADIKTDGATIAAGGVAEIEACITFSALFPEMDEIGLPGFQLGIDLPSLGLASGPIPLGLFEIPDLSPFAFNGLLHWFGGLVGFDWQGLVLKLPSYDLDVPALIGLPFGIGVRESRLALAMDGGVLVLVARAADFFLTWRGTEVLDLGGRLELTYDSGSGIYRFEATLAETSYPKTQDGEPFAFSFPLGVLGLSARCWYLSVGLYASNAGGPICFQVLLEIGGLTVKSSLSGDKNLYTADLRILARDFAVIVNKVPTNPKVYFLAKAPKQAPFSDYQAIAIPAYSFARDLRAPEPDPALANDYGLDFLAGDLKAGERAFVAWRQRGDRLLRALAHDILGRAPAGSVADGETATLFGLEFARFPDGSVQARLDWRRADAKEPTLTATGQAPPERSEGCFDVEPEKPVAFNLPLPSKGVGIGPPVNAMAFDLPAIALRLAPPRDQAIVLRREPDGHASVGHLLMFDLAADTAQPAPALAYASIGFSLTDRSGASETREIAETNEDSAFLTAALGRVGSGRLALRTVGWRVGSTPRFLQTLRPDAPPPDPLLPNTIGAPTTGDPGCPGPPAPTLPPAALAFDAFETPRFADDGWRLSVRIAATKSLFKALQPPAGSANQRVSFDVKRICHSDQDPDAALIETELAFALGEDFSAEGHVTFRFDVRDLALSVVDGASLDFRLPRQEMPGWAAEASLPGKPDDYWYSVPKTLLGFEMTALVQAKEGEAAPKAVEALVLQIVDGRFLLVQPEGGIIVLRYTGFGGDALTFLVRRFEIGPGGLDLDAELVASTLRVKGLKRPFALDKAALRIRGSRLEYLSVDASGRLPELLNEAPVKLTITFKQEQQGGRVELDEIKSELGDKDHPIFSRGIRFKFEITTLDMSYHRDGAGGERHFFFELTGSAQFAPEGDEFAGGVLEDLKSVRLDFVRAPLSDEVYKGVSLVVELKRPVTFKVYNLFRMEIRSIGFDPYFEKFAEPGPAVIIGGQCEFAFFGDVLSADISFHAMRIGLPKAGDWQPQVHFDGLRVDISSSEGFRIGGRVDRFDGDTLKGFKGEGTVQVPGFPELSAAFAFVRLRKDASQDWKHAWFVAIEAARISYQLAPLPIYLRQIGLGFGYRYTLPLIKEFEKPGTIRELITAMLAALDRHPTLARIEAWTEEADKPGAPWTIALEGMFTLGSSQESPWDYDAKREEKVKTLIAQIIAAFRSDFTLVAAAKLWYPVSVDDFFNDREGMRRRPLASGFMIYSAPQSRFLAHAAKGHDPYLGPKDDPVPETVKDVLRRGHFEATLLIERDLVHAELGWPDRIMFSFELGGLSVECRGGVLFRLERDVLIQGIFFSARGVLNLSGGIDLGFIGVRVEATANIQYAARLLIAQYLSKPINSKIYAAIGIDIAVRFSISAWLKLKIGFVRINISISFAIDVQIAVALELGWAGGGDLGFRGRARLSIGVFGRTLDVSVAVGVNEGGVEAARAALAPYMGSLLEPGQVPPMPGFDKVGLGQRSAPFASVLEGFAETLELTAARALDPVDAFVTAHIEGAEGADGQTLWFVWVMPGPDKRAFYPPLGSSADEPTPIATLDLGALGDTAGQVFVVDGNAGWKEVTTSQADLLYRPGRRLNLSEGQFLTLDQLIAGCWVPTKPEDYGEADHLFPDIWPGKTPKLVVPEYGPDNARAATVDRRAFEPGGIAGPRGRRLDSASSEDSSLAATLQKDDIDTQDPAKWLPEQARGNETILLQGFHDDLVTIARTTAFVGGVPITPPLPGGRPTLLDSGMILCVRAPTKPAWIETRDAAAAPTIQFVPEHGLGTPQPFPLRPVVDFTLLDFERSSPNFPDFKAHLDEELVAVAFTIAWPREVHDSQFASKARKDVEPYLRAYEISFVDLSDDRLLKFVTVTPTETTTSAGGPKRAPYQYVVPRAAIVPDDDLDDLHVRRIAVTVRPVSQTGRAGRGVSDVLTFEPVLTPLPADDARLTLTLTREGGAVGALLRWRQLVLPASGAVAQTTGWQLILRPLRRTPLGAYPDKAADVNDRGLMSVTGQALLDGDILVDLTGLKWKAPAPYKPGEPADPGNEDQPPERDPAERIYTLDLEENGALPGPVFDHLGQPHSEGTPLYEVAASFFARQPASQGGGRAWRLFLRAVSRRERGAPDAVAVSGLAPVQFLAAWPKTQDAPITRPLPHLEWPAAETFPPVTRGDIRATPGPIAVAVVEGGNGDVAFKTRPGTARAITVSWNAAPSDSADWRPPQAYAAFDIFEEQLGDFINADLDPDSGFKPRWRLLRQVAPAEPELARQIPATMSDTPNWEAQYPAFAKSLHYLETKKIHQRDMPAKWPAWYSWDESELVWPPLEPFANLPVPDPGSWTAHDVADHAGKVAVWRDIGRRTASGLVHDYLAAILGQMVDAGGIGVEARYEVRVSVAPPSPIADPVRWMETNTEALDPYGWGALARLGLAVVVTLRDPVSGLTLSQDEIWEQLETARKAVDPNGSAFSRHLAVDRPIQHARAYRTETGSAHFRDLALDMIQLSLRPIPEPRPQTGQLWTYEVLKLKDEEPGDAKVDLPPKCRIVFPTRERPAVSNDDASASQRLVAAVFRPGEVALARHKGAANSLRDALGTLIDPKGQELRERHAEKPVPLFDKDGDATLSPFGRFGHVLADWHDHLIGSPSFAAFRSYLARAFKQPISEGASEGLEDELKREPLQTKLLAAYLPWSARLFRTAPIVTGDVTPAPTDYVAVAQPRSVDPVTVAADSLGRLSYTRFVEEEWAGERSYAVRPVGRYARFLPVPDAKAPEPPAFGSDRADAGLPRVRRLEPPTLLSARVLRSGRGRSFNELIIAHPERTIVRSNVTVHRLLAFGEVQRAYQRTFAYPEWLDLLESTSALEGGAAIKQAMPHPLPRHGTAADEVPDDLSESTSSLLGAVPQARWGADRYVDAAEPFYYRASVRVRATAGQVVSEERAVVLPSPKPDPLAPRAPDPVESGFVDWFGRKDQQAQFERWRTEFPEDTKIGRRLARDGVRLCIRLPRLVESLSRESLGGRFAYEDKLFRRGDAECAPFGFLPDPDVRVLVIDSHDGTTATLAQIVPTPDTKATKAFETTPLSSDVAVDWIALKPGSEGWPTGVFAALDVRPVFPPASVTADHIDLPEFAAPTELKAFDPAVLLPANALPTHGALAQLAPLALRVKVEENGGQLTVSQLDPLAGGRWLARPHLAEGQPGADAPLAQADLAIGLRLVADVERRRAAALLCHDVEAGGGGLPLATALLRRAEECDLAVLLRRDRGILDSEAVLAECLRHGASLWHRSEGDAVWTRIAKPQQPEETGWKLLIVRVEADDNELSPVDALINRLSEGFIASGKPVSRVRHGTAAALLGELAAKAYRPAPMRAPLVFVQRGNEPRIPWGTVAGGSR